MASHYWSKLAQELADIVEVEAKKLRAAGFDELAALQVADRDIEIKGRSGHIHRFVERTDESTVRIVLQGSVPGRWRILGSHCHVVGFEKTRDGVLKELDDNEMFSYS